MLTILAAIFVFGVLVTVHEFGHFITAKLTGMTVYEFAIGFGPKLYQHKEGGTEYTLRAIPLGGFNNIAGMDPDEPLEEGSFRSKSIPARMLVILAGSLMNFILPIILFTGIFFVQGQQVAINEPIIGTVVADAAADRAGIKPGDKILTINGKDIASWNDIIAILRNNGTNTVQLTALSEGQVKSYTMEPVYDRNYNRALIGIIAKSEHRSYSLGESFIMGFEQTKYVATAMVDGLSRIVTGREAPNLAGPIGVAQMAGQEAEKGVLNLIQFVAFLSINLGIINLLPLPALDGGHFILLCLEALRGKPLGSDAMYNIQKVGIALILALTLFTTFKDITR